MPRATARGFFYLLRRTLHGKLCCRVDNRSPNQERSKKCMEGGVQENVGKRIKERNRNNAPPEHEREFYLPVFYLEKVAKRVNRYDEERNSEKREEWKKNECNGEHRELLKKS